MQRAERFLKLVQILRRHRLPVSAEALAEELGVSMRTIYRDVAALGADGVPIRGEAGIGYVLEGGYDLPPLMFTADELEAVLVGMRWVEARADLSLARAASDVIAKLGVVVPRSLRPVLLEGTLDAPRYSEGPPADGIDVAAVRRAIREERKLRLLYIDSGGQQTERTVWPLGLAYFDLSRLVVAWCELRNDFRHFRTDRMVSASVLDAKFHPSRSRLLARWRESERARGA